MPNEFKVTMFTDQVGSTAAMKARTPSETAQVAREQEVLTAEVARLCRGTILKDTGDGHILAFGSCRDAVLAGYLLQQRVGERNQATANSHLRFDLHVGIDAGDSVVLPDGDIRANSANLAARVCSQCPSGKVYLTELVRSQVHEREAETAPVGNLDFKGVTGPVPIYRLERWLGNIPKVPNPFTSRRGITLAPDFFNRTAEQGVLQSHLVSLSGGSCQVVGPGRIGKSSLLRQIQREAAGWRKGAVVAYLDLQGAHCTTLAGWIQRAAQQWGWKEIPGDMVGFHAGVEEMTAKELTPVLCLDEFQALREHTEGFPVDFLGHLRSCIQHGIAAFTASREPLHKVTDPKDEASPFYNLFPILDVGPFLPDDSADFVALYRPGIPRFAPAEKEAILAFGRGHPLALQVACFYGLESTWREEPVSVGLQKAAREMSAMLPSGW